MNGGERPLLNVVQGDRSLPTFDEWIERKGYRASLKYICSRGTLGGQLIAIRSLYRRYKDEIGATTVDRDGG